MAPGDLLRIEHHLDGLLYVLELTGELDLATAATLPAALGPVARSRVERLLVDLRGVTLLDSTGVRALLHVRRWMYNRGGRVRFVCHHEPAGRVLAMMGLYDALDMGDDYARAVADLA